MCRQKKEEDARKKKDCQPFFLRATGPASGHETMTQELENLLIAEAPETESVFILTRQKKKPPQPVLAELPDAVATSDCSKHRGVTAGNGSDPRRHNCCRGGDPRPELFPGVDHGRITSPILFVSLLNV